MEQAPGLLSRVKESIPQAWALSPYSLGSLDSCLKHPSLHPSSLPRSQTPPAPHGALQPKELSICLSLLVSGTLFSIPGGVS